MIETWRSAACRSCSRGWWPHPPTTCPSCGGATHITGSATVAPVRGRDLYDQATDDYLRWEIEDRNSNRGPDDQMSTEGDRAVLIARLRDDDIEGDQIARANFEDMMAEGPFTEDELHQ